MALFSLKKSSVEVLIVIEVNLMKRASIQPSEFFSRHRIALCALFLSCAMITVMMGHKLSVAHSKPATPAAESVETASAGQSSSQG